MNHSLWDPFNELENLRGLARLHSGNPPPPESAVASNWAPAVDILEEDQQFIIKADLPEVKKDEVSVTFNNGMLTISGERHFENLEDDGTRKYHRVERSYGHYSRSFRLPDSVDPEGLAAAFKDGVLTVRIPKREELKPKQIEVKVE